jgi:U3 small nucleolar RNA-associated protein 23
MLYIKRSVMIMEPMAGASSNVKDKEEKAKFRAGLTAARGAKRLRGAEDDEDYDGEGEAMMRAVRTLVDRTEGRKEGEAGNDAEPVKKKRKRGPSGPNPMSVKKKKEPVLPVSKKVQLVRDVETASAATIPQGEGIAAEAAPDNTAEQTTLTGTTMKTKRKRKHKSAAASEAADPALETQEETAT